jgi:hypothetical protein
MEMHDNPERLVPKVHPASREVMPGDPMALYATAARGDVEVLLRSVVQEYAWMGWGADQITALFHDPCFPLLHGLGQVFGEDGLRQRIEAVFRRLGGFRFQSTIYEQPVETMELVQLGAGSRQENDHAASQ